MGEAAASVVGFDEALVMVLSKAAGLGGLGIEALALLDSIGRVLAQAVLADRDQPPFDRSTRDGFAVRAAEIVHGELRIAGQVRAGERWQGGPLEQFGAIEIMTGAPIPEAADAVVMVEHVERSGAALGLAEGRTIQAGDNVVLRGSEARAGEAVIAPGAMIGGAEIALAAACGYATLTVFRRPRVAIVATGDELVELDQVPEDQQIRNSNSYGLAALVENAGGEAVRMPIARDRREELGSSIRRARGCDLLLLSGGVSMGEYDLVEEVLLELGAELFFTGVRMQPGKPVVFGRLPATGEFSEQFFFGLPGNPISTQVTFHCFVEPLLRAMGGAAVGSSVVEGQVVEGPRFVQATLAEDVAGKAGLMRVLPARLTSGRVSPQVRVVEWHGSGDLAANARANCYAVLPPDKDRFLAGDVITILLRSRL